jgi:hypothetical protein
MSCSVVCFDGCGLLDRLEVYQVAQSEATTKVPGFECLPSIVGCGQAPRTRCRKRACGSVEHMLQTRAPIPT